MNTPRAWTRFIGGSALALTLLWTAPIVAQDATGEAADDGFQAQLDEALAHYEGRRYVEAATAFQAAYEIREEPELMYNIARSYERGLRREEAVAAYDRFLELPGTTSEMRSRARAARDSLQGELDAMNPPDEPEQTGGSSGQTAPPPASTTDDDDGGMGLAPVGWVLLGLGGATVGVGAVFGGVAISSNDDFNAATDRDEQVRLQGEVRRFALLSDILIGTGAGLAIAGIVFLVVELTSGGGDDDASASNEGLRDLDVQPVLGPDLVGVTLRASF